MVSAMGSGSWARSSGPRFSFWQPFTTVTSLSHWCDHLYYDDVAGLPGIDALSRLAPYRYEVTSPSNRSRGNFLLIAGTFTPFALGPLRGGGGLAMLGIVWALALFGVIMKAHAECCVIGDLR